MGAASRQLLASLVVVALVGPGVGQQWVTVPGANAVPNCGSTCTTLPRERCVGSYPTATGCAATCENTTAGRPYPYHDHDQGRNGTAPCRIWTWSASTQHCWHRTDCAWAPTNADSKIVSGCLASGPGRVDGCMAPNTLAVSALQRGRVSPHSPGVALDFWLPEDGKYGLQWGNASLLLLDLGNPLLIELATALAPGLLRLGGSPSDSIVYDLDGTCARGKGTPGGSPVFGCSQTGKATYGCLTGQRWRELLEFAAMTGLHVVLGLNDCNGRTSASSPMDWTNIQALLNFTVTLPPATLAPLVGFEFGNEVLIRGVAPKRWALDAAELATRLQATFAAAGLSAPGVIGPDDYSSAGYPELFSNLKPGVVQAITYHDYPQCEPSTAAGFTLEPSCLARLGSTADQFRGEAVRAYGAEVWSGEGADHTATGGDFGHDFLPTFFSSFYYTYLHGVLPLHNVTLSARQCLVGGNYGLLNKTTFEPNPDFFVAWAYRRLFSDELQLDVVSRVVNSSSPDPGFRAFAFGSSDPTDPRVVLTAINLSTETPATVQLLGCAKSPRQEWHFLGDPGPSATRITINGHSPWTPGRPLPAFASLAVSAPPGSNITLQPASVAFFSLRC